MGFIERIRQGEANRELRVTQLIAEQEALGKERYLKTVVEIERCAQRRLQAEKFRQESGVGLAIDELVAFLETLTVPVNVTQERDGFFESYTKYVGRGSRGLPAPFVFINGFFPDTYSRGIDQVDLKQRDLDSVLDIVHWDVISKGSPSTFRSYTTKDSYKYIAAESCPDGTFVFHGGFLGSTTKRLTEWRIKDREQIIAVALEKAFSHPRVHRYTVGHYVSPGF